ncbi:MAG: DUF5989 family protein [Bryobacteraceae bacterium]
MPGMRLAREVVLLLRENKKWWMLPVIFTLMLLGVLLVLAQTSAVAPCIYTLF